MNIERYAAAFLTISEKKILEAWRWLVAKIRRNPQPKETNGNA